MRILKITILLSILLLSSCDCPKVITGSVIDKNSQQPIPGVKVYISNNPSCSNVTDSSGKYEIYYLTYGPLCYLKQKKKVIAEKQGYQKTTEIEAVNTIEMVLDSNSLNETR